MRLRLIALLLAFLGGAPAIAGAGGDVAPGLNGLVKHSAGPLEQAGIYAYRVTDLNLTRATTDLDGRFSFRVLPAGVYKIVAHKTGYLPAVGLFTRATQLANDFLEFELVEEREVAYEDDDDFWSIRRKIPGDVLREIRLAEAEAEAEHEIGVAAANGFAVETEMLAGNDNRGAGDSQLTSGYIGVAGQIGRVQLSLDGRFDSLNASSNNDQLGDSGHTNAIGLSLQGADNTAVSVDTVRHRFDSMASRAKPVDLESYRVDWAQQHGADARSAVSARYVAETGFHTQAGLSPVGVPEASTALRLNGSHTQQVRDGVSVRAGVEYQELRQDASLLAAALPGRDRQWVNAYGLGSMEMRDGFVVEYGLYSTLYDGDVTFSPHGGAIVDMGDKWQARAEVRHRVADRETELPNFAIAYYRDLGAEASSEDHFYRLGLTHRFNETEAVHLRAVHREVSDTLRVFFNEDFFDQLASIYLVPGDELPELQFELTQKLAPDVYTTVESNVGVGGGGTFVTSSDGSFENQVRYLVTSMDTRFHRTETGVFLAFHRVEQDLEPLRNGSASTTGVDIDKIQIKLTQELGYFLDIGTDWAVLLDLQISRGATPYLDDAEADELRRRIAGGVALRF
jgi:hypothetical protein